MANAIVTQRDTQLERQRAGYIQLSLTNFTNDDEPTIAAGSVVEISGTLYSVTSNESITGWAGVSNGPVWIKLIPAGTDPFTAEYTDVAPTWIDAKQGWYDGTGTDRYVAGLTKTGASGYSDKFTMTAVERGNMSVEGVFPFSRHDVIEEDGSWVVPPGVHRIKATICSGGSGGGGSSSSGTDGYGGGGGSTRILRDAEILMRAPGPLGGLPEWSGASGLLTAVALSNTIGDIIIVGQRGTAGTTMGGTGGSSHLGGGASNLASRDSAGSGSSAQKYGGGGGGSQSTTEGAGGGLGGTTCISIIDVTPGETLTIEVGAGGAGGLGARTGGDGAPGVVIIEY